MEENNNALAEKPTDTHFDESILDEPDPPDRVMDETEVDGEKEGQVEPMEVLEENNNTPQKKAEIVSDKNKVELGKRSFDFAHPISFYGAEKRSGVEMVLPKEIRDELSLLQQTVAKLAENQEKTNKKLEKLDEFEKKTHELDKKVKEQDALILSMNVKIDTWRLGLNAAEKRSVEAKNFSEHARDSAVKVEMKMTKAEERIEKAHKLIEDIDNDMKKFNRQQMDFSEARVKLAKEELKSDFQVQIAEVKYSEKQAKLAIKKVDLLSKKVTSNTNICQETQKELKKTKIEARSATSLAKAKENPWQIQGPPKSRMRFDKIRAEQNKATKESEPEDYRVCIRVPDIEAQEDLNKLGAKIDDIHGKGTVKFGTRTRSGHIKFFITKKEVAETAEKWIQDVGQCYSILETEDWYKGVLYGIPKHISSENLRKEVETNNGVKLKMDPVLMKENPSGNTFLLCFESAEQYFKCERGVLLQYQRFRMRMYQRKSDEEFRAHKLRRAKADAEKADNDKQADSNKQVDSNEKESSGNQAEVNESGSNVAPNDNISNNDY